MHDTPEKNSGRTADPILEQLTGARGYYSPENRELVQEVVTAVLTTISGDLNATETSLLGEVEALGRTIAAAKQEIAALRVDDIRDRDIPFATDELDAIVDHTAVATNSILESCELLDGISAEVTGEAAAKLQDAVTKIYEACSFQDITGQRITKVVTTLKTIEAKVAQIITAFGVHNAQNEAPAADALRPGSDADLLNGPQLPSNAMDQSDIDKLLASFG
jgi:chemotaxis protein CheZ